MNRILRRLTYANVMSSIAVFLVVAGGSALAANQLGKNTVGSKQLKKNAVTGAKIKNGAVTGAKIKAGSITGAQVNVGSLGTVPSATNAVHATSADTATKAGSATKADSAGSVDQIKRIFYTGNEGDPERTILEIGGLTVREECESENEISATTSVDHTVIDVVTAQDNDYSVNENFSVGETFDLDENHSEDFTEMYTAQYTRPDGVNVVITLHDVDAGDGPVFPGTSAQSDCMVAGIATVS